MGALHVPRPACGHRDCRQGRRLGRAAGDCARSTGYSRPQRHCSTAEADAAAFCTRLGGDPVWLDNAAIRPLAPADEE